VFWGSQSSKFNDRASRPEGYFGSIAGEEIKSRDFYDAQREVALRYFFTYGDWPDERDAKRVGFDVGRETYFRLLLIQKQKQLDIHVSDETVASVARQIQIGRHRLNSSH